MEVSSWPAECVIKLIQWKYGTLIPLQELQRIQRIDYDPGGGSLGRFCRTLTRCSNAVVLFALSFAIVNASGHYVNHGASPSPMAGNGSDLYARSRPPPSPGTGHAAAFAAAAALAQHDLRLDASLPRISALPVAAEGSSVLLVYGGGHLTAGTAPTSAADVASSAFSTAAARSRMTAAVAVAAATTTTTTMTIDHPHPHISSIDDRNDSARVATNDSSAEFGVDSFAPTLTAILLSTNDTQVPQFSNRTPHANETNVEGVGYFGVLSVVLGLMILLTIVGNVFVIAAIIIEKNLQNVANYLIVSLAVADLMVACLVMPLGAVYEISEGWVLGPELCDMWTASDVLCCTASILHLVAIALDRYWAVTDVEYITRRSAWRIVAMIIIIWTVALVVSVAPQFGWKDPEYMDRINLEKRCLVSQDIGYQIFATCATFYVPLLAILVLYWKIFQAARRRIHKRNLRNPMYNATVKKGAASIARKRFAFFSRKPKIKADAETGTATNIALMDIPSSCSAAESSQENAKGGDCHDNNRPDHICVDRQLQHANSHDPAACTSAKICVEASMPALISKHIQKGKSKRDKKQSIEAKREKKAAKTLAIITGAFVICWLPFFVMALAMPMCSACHINRYVSSFFLWLGYFNSTLNPIIYTVFSPEFRQAFNRILCGIHNSGLRAR